VGLPTGREPHGNGASVLVSGRESRLQGQRGEKKPNGEGKQVSHGQDVKVREMRRAETFLNIIEDPGKLYEAEVKETRKLESRMMRQVSSPVRRRAGRKGQ
jgi:hypothetical protein